MKKCTSIIAFSALCAALACAATACEPEENAQLIVCNRFEDDIAALWLTGDETTGNLIESGLEIEAGDADGCDEYGEFEEFTDLLTVAPGKYEWHVAMAASVGDFTYDGGEEIKLYPGRNYFVIGE
jgi:hypothetical protein